jgi:selenocysteine lyase/cysteine desulfurase
MAWLQNRRGARIVKIDLPEPATRQGLIDAYVQAFEANPHLRLALLTHVSHRTGLILPVAEIAEQARMEAAFLRCCQYEWMFWNAAYHRETWPV